MVGALGNRDRPTPTKEKVVSGLHLATAKGRTVRCTFGLEKGRAEVHLPSRCSARRRNRARPEFFWLPCALALEDSMAARSAILALHARVPGEELEAVILCRVDGLSHPEAAEVLDVSERTVRRLLERFDAGAARWRKEFTS